MKSFFMLYLFPQRLQTTLHACGVWRPVRSRGSTAATRRLWCAWPLTTACSAEREERRSDSQTMMQWGGWIHGLCFRWEMTPECQLQGKLVFMLFVVLVSKAARPTIKFTNQTSTSRGNPTFWIKLSSRTDLIPHLSFQHLFLEIPLFIELNQL